MQESIYNDIVEDANFAFVGPMGNKIFKDVPFASMSSEASRRKRNTCFSSPVSVLPRGTGGAFAGGLLVLAAARRGAAHHPERVHVQ